MKYRIIIFACTAFFLAGHSANLFAQEARFSIIEEGFASWYGSEFAGRPTANGEIYNPSLLTAAHQSLPFGTMVKVTNLANGKTVSVRINDRGPFKPGRIIDLSQEAATKIDLVVMGVSNVRIESDKAVIPQTKPRLTDPSPTPTTDVALRTVQIISFSNLKSAETLNASLQQQGFACVIENAPNGFFRIIIPSLELSKVPGTLEQLKLAGFPEVLLRKQ